MSTTFTLPTTLLATTSESKRDEWRKIAQSLRGEGAPEFTILEQKIGFVEIQSLDTEQVAVAKALDAFYKLGRPALVEDSAFEIFALNKFPGPLYAHAQNTITNLGLCDHVTSLARGRSCAAIITIAYCSADGQTVYTARGQLVGVMPLKPQGSDKFGYDNIVVPDGFTETLAEMGDRKNDISMRRKAIEALLAGNVKTHQARESVVYRAA